MAFRVVSSVVVALSMASLAAAQAVIESTTSEGEAQMMYPTCEVNVDEDPKTFETVYVTAEKLTSFQNSDVLEGPCTDYLGPLCDDGLKCTVDYDYDELKCLPEPREVVSNCVETL